MASQLDDARRAARALGRSREVALACAAAAESERDAARAERDPNEIERLRHDLLLPKYFFTSPLDYDIQSRPPKYEPAIVIPGVELPVPPPPCRPGYSPDDDRFYLDWGNADHDFIVEIIHKHRRLDRNLAILD